MHHSAEKKFTSKIYFCFALNSLSFGQMTVKQLNAFMKIVANKSCRLEKYRFSYKLSQKPAGM